MAATIHLTPSISTNLLGVPENKMATSSENSKTKGKSVETRFKKADEEKVLRKKLRHFRLEQDKQEKSLRRDLIDMKQCLEFVKADDESKKRQKDEKAPKGRQTDGRCPEERLEDGQFVKGRQKSDKTPRKRQEDDQISKERRKDDRIAEDHEKDDQVGNEREKRCEIRIDAKNKRLFLNISEEESDQNDVVCSSQRDNRDLNEREIALQFDGGELAKKGRVRDAGRSSIARDTARKPTQRLYRTSRVRHIGEHSGDTSTRISHADASMTSLSPWRHGYIQSMSHRPTRTNLPPLGTRK